MFPSEHCNEIMKKLKLKPASQYFLKYPDIKSEDYKDYPQVIKKHIDIGIITNKINSGDYKTVSEWRQDVELMFSNAIKYFAKFRTISLPSKQVLLYNQV